MSNIVRHNASLIQLISNKKVITTTIHLIHKLLTKLYFDTRVSSILIVFQDSISKVIKFDSQMITDIKIDASIKYPGRVCLFVMSTVHALTLKCCSYSGADMLVV